MDKLRAFQVQLGYAEETLLSTLRFYHVDGFHEVEEAMEHLRLTAVAFVRKARVARACCRAHVHVDGYSFCPKCGRRLDDARDPGPGDVQQFFYGLPTMTTDRASATGLLDHLGEHGWDITGDPAEPAVLVRGVGRWMGRDGERDRPYMEWTFPDWSEGSTR